MDEQTVFTAALELDSTRRGAFLDEACAGDSELRQRVEKLLEVHEGAAGFMVEPAGVLTRIPDQPISEKPGTQIGPYKLIEEIGKGGMGVVYRALDCQQNIDVALKMLLDPSPMAVFRLKREFRSLVDFGHRNLVVFDKLFCVDGRWFFTMELIRGTTFTEYVRPLADPGVSVQSPETGAESAAYGTTLRRLVSVGIETDYGRLRHALAQVVLGLNALHQAGMLHRDIKPSNVLVSREGRVVLVDFGLVAELKALCPGRSRPATWAGTQPYMSPEQMAAQPLTFASDWYGVGAMLYETLTGSVPFAGDWETVLSQKWSGPPPEALQSVPAEHSDLAVLCAELLQPAPEKRPAGSDIVDRIRGPDGKAEEGFHNRAPLDRPVFVGRRTQLAELHRALTDVQAGQAVRMYVHGRPGMGKTALVSRFLSAPRPGVETIVLQGRCYEREAMPYKAMDSLVDAIVQHLDGLTEEEIDSILPEDVRSLVRVFPALLQVQRIARIATRGVSPLDDRDARVRAITSFREILRHLADRAVLVLVLDDLQWGDVDSALFLSELLSPPQAPPVLFIACYRSDDRRQSACLRTLLNESEQRRRMIEQREIVLDEMSPDETQQLLAILLGSEGADGEDRSALCQLVGGSPYLITEISREVTREGRTAMAKEGIPRDLVSILRRRVERLPESPRRLLTMVAGSSHPIQLDLACKAAGVGLEPDVAVAVLRSERLIRTVDETTPKVAVYHHCIGEAAMALLSPHECEALHFRLAVTLEAAIAPDPAELCRHFENAGDYERAGHYAFVAAERAARSLAFDQAAAMYRAALVWRKKTPLEELSVRRKLADMLANAGRNSEAAQQYAELAAMVDDPVVRTEMQHRVAIHYLISGHIDTGRVWLDRALNDAGISVPKSRWQTLASLLVNRTRLRMRGFHLSRPDGKPMTQRDRAVREPYWCAVVGLSVIDPLLSSCFAARNLLYSLKRGDATLAARALAIEAVQLAHFGAKGRARTDRVLAQAIAMAEQSGTPYSLAIVEMASGATAFLQGNWQQAIVRCGQGEQMFRRIGLPVFWELATSNMFQLFSLYFLGSIRQLAQQVRISLDDAKERADLYTQLNLGTFVESFLWLAADDVEIAKSELDALIARWSSSGWYIQHVNSLFAKTHIAAYEGHGDAALQATRELRAALHHTLLWRSEHFRVFSKDYHARALLVAAQTTRNRQLLLRSAASVARSLGKELHPCAAGLAWLVRASLAQASGSKDDAATFLGKALAVLEQTGLHLHAAVARRRLGEILGGQEGDAMVTQADAWMRCEGIVNTDRMANLFCPWLAEGR